MTITELIDNRYSCRNYKSDAVDKSLVAEICLQAVKAPSACNSQPWKIHALTGEKKAALAEALTGLGLNAHAKIAPVILAIEETSAKYISRLTDVVPKNNWAKIDLGILTAHIILLAKEKGLDTCVIGYNPNVELAKKVLGTDNEIPLFITLGYAADGGTTPEKRRKNADEVFEILD